MATEGTKAVVVALLANAGIALAKTVGFLITGASSMLAEAVHSVADSGNQALLLLGTRLSQRPQSGTHPFGYARERYFWSFVVALVIFALGAGFAIYEGIHKLAHPEPLRSPEVAIGILVVGVALEAWSFWTAIRAASKLRGQRPWLAFIRETKQAELPVVLLEDLGALIGLVVALLGVALSAITGNVQFDAIGSILIGLLLGVIAVILAIEMKSLLIGEAAGPEVQAAISAAIGEDPAVTHIAHLKTTHLGPEQVLVAAKICLEGNLPLTRVASVINAAEERIRAAVPMAQLIYLEPDVLRPDDG